MQWRSRRLKPCTGRLALLRLRWPRRVEATSAQKPSTAARIKSPCRESIRENSAVDCTSGQKHKPHSMLAVNERPAIAAVPIGHRDDPTVLPPEPAAPVVATLPEDAVTATPTETPPAAPPFTASLPEDAVAATPTEAPSAAPTSLPAVAPKRAQRHQRENREYASIPSPTPRVCIHASLSS